MKRIVTLLLAAGLVMGAASMSQATDIKVKGMWDFTFEYATNLKKGADVDNFHAKQRLRTQVDFIASENLKGVVFFEMGDTNWGKKSEGGQMGTDGKIVEVRYSYIDWVIPETDVKVRMGLQPWKLPNFVVAEHNVIGGPADAAGITLSYDFNENFGLTAFWMRPANDNGSDIAVTRNISDTLDLFGFTVPMQFDGFKVTPWFMGAVIGRDSMGNTTSTTSYVKNDLMPIGAIPALSRNHHGHGLWAGATAEMTLFDPFRLALDLNYGNVNLNEIDKVGDLKRDGWLIEGVAEYKLDYMTPGLIFWYASGDDDDPFNGSERMPTLHGSSWMTTYGFDGNYAISTTAAINRTLVGTWGIGLQLKDISFIDDLKSTLRVVYMQGTNDKAMAPVALMAGGVGLGERNGLYLTEEDNAIEVNFDTQYKIYKNLTLITEIGYVHLNLDDGTWGSAYVDSIRKNNYRAALNLRYSF